MGFEGFVRFACRAAVVASACGFVSACGGTTGFEPVHEASGSVIGAIGSKLGHLVGLSDIAPTAAPLPQSDQPVECPSMDVQDGTASARFYKGAESNENVRYAFTVGDVARECSKVGGQLQLKVGVAGRLLIGPAGEAGTYSVPLRIAVRNDATQKPLSSQLARVTATVQPGQSQADFTFVTEPFAVPFTPHPDDDYTILVGFDTTGKAAAEPAAPHRHRKPKG